VKHLPKPGLDLRRAFGFVRDDVLKSTGFKQEPYVYGSLGGDDVPLVPSTSAGASQPGTPDAVRRDYELALQIGTREVWTAFLAQYPEGFYASLAKGQLARIAANDGRAGSASDVGKSEQDKAGTAADRTDPGSVEKPPITKSAEAPSVARPVAEAKPTAREEPKKDEPAPKERVASLPPAQTSVTPKPSCRSGQLPNTRGECEAPRRAEPAYGKKEQGVASRTELSEPREPRGGRCTSISQRCAMEIGGRCDPATGKWEYGRNGAGGNTLAFNTCIGRMMAGNKR
jgi:hypothetical protein